MTTTLRPTEPLSRTADGGRSRRYRICVDGRPVGSVHLVTSASISQAARIVSLSVDAPERRRGRATVAALAAEEVTREWGCRVIEASLPAEAGAALRLAGALGYTPRARRMRKRLGETPPPLPSGVEGRPMTAPEFGPWLDGAMERYTRALTDQGMSPAEASAKSALDHAAPREHGTEAEGMRFGVLESEGDRVATLWLGLRRDAAHVFDVRVEDGRRGRGHGRATMLLAERLAVGAGQKALELNVFAGNTPAERLYDSLGYEPVTIHLAKPLA
ncbi:GNAT family N-acetyltransferase [Streptomyces sp. ZYX-F-203]